MQNMTSSGKCTDLTVASVSAAPNSLFSVNLCPSRLAWEEIKGGLYPISAILKILFLDTIKRLGEAQQGQDWSLGLCSLVDVTDYLRYSQKLNCIGLTGYENDVLRANSTAGLHLAIQTVIVNGFGNVLFSYILEDRPIGIPFLFYTNYLRFCLN